MYQVTKSSSGAAMNAENHLENGMGTKNCMGKRKFLRFGMMAIGIMAGIVFFNGCKDDPPPPSPLPAVTGLTAVQVEGGIEISWNAVEGAGSYSLSKGGSVIAEGIIYRYFDSTPDADNYYTVTVCRSDDTGCSYSDIYCAYEIDRPQNLKVTQNGKDITFTWTPMPSYLYHGQILWWGNSPDDAVNDKAEDLMYFWEGENSYTVDWSEHSPGVYYFWVQAYDGSGVTQNNLLSDAVQLNYNYIPPGGGTATGLYMGIIGFNQSLSEKSIGLLTNYDSENNRYDFQDFVNSLEAKDGTGLYYAVDNAINRLQAADLPADLDNVSIVTFTDGLDNVSIDLNTNYNTRDAYRDAIKDRIANTKIKNLPINAYSIGVQGSDVTDEASFDANLAYMASSADKAFKVANMTEVNNTFEQIAASLYNENQSQSIALKMTGGYDDNTKIRFTFDNVTDAAASNLYIEGTYRRNGSVRTLEDVVYNGLTSSSGVKVTGSVDGVFVTFTFNGTALDAGGNVTVTNTQQWEWIAASSLWQRNKEFGGAGDVEIIVDRKSAVVMLVLDCTTSLDATGFSQMQSAANNFITVLTSAQ